MRSSIYDIHNAEDGCACSMVCQLFCQSASRGAGWCAGNSGQSVQSDRSIIACPHFDFRPYLQLLGTVLEQLQHISVHDQPVTALRGGGWAEQRVFAGLDAAPHVHLCRHGTNEWHNDASAWTTQCRSLIYVHVLSRISRCIRVHGSALTSPRPRTPHVCREVQLIYLHAGVAAVVAAASV